MPTQITSAQSQSLGGAAPCQPAKPIVPNSDVATSDTPPGTSVLILDLEKEGWIGIALVDTKQQPVPNEAFVVTPAGRDPVQGNLDGFGRVRIEGLEPGATCTIEFPKLHRREFVRSSS